LIHPTGEEGLDVRPGANNLQEQANNNEGDDPGGEFFVVKRH
jgi:hypothetical protein